jgi:hypothetical protein
MGASHTPRHASAALLHPAHRSLAIRASFLVLVLGAALFALARTNAGAATAFSTMQPGTFTGKAFDACTAPSSATMAAWKGSSPYGGIGVYIGGVSRGCPQANLTASWVQTQVTAGWKLLPLYVGPQASCNSTMSHRIDNATAGAMGQSAATDAAAQAAALGLAKGSVLIYDMEAYNSADAACKTGVLTFMNGFTVRLHTLGYYSGYYSSAGSGIADMVANYTASGYAPPDYVDFARWDGVVTAADPVLKANTWPGHRRMKQYQGGHDETWGGVKINVDSNYVDYAPLPNANMGDFTGDGLSDLLAKDPATGNLYWYPGDGKTLQTSKRGTVGSGWNGMNAIVRIGDLNKDGREDAVARDANGDLWFYPGTNGGFGARTKLASGWKALREIAAVGDLNRDGYPDLAAIDGQSLYLYPGKAGATLGARTLLSQTGWGLRTEVTGVGDFNGDGIPDLFARDNVSGTLYRYLGAAGGKLAGRASLGTGWAALRDLVGVGDFDRDGYTDLIATRKSDNAVQLFRGNGKKLDGGTTLANLGAFTPLA